MLTPYAPPVPGGISSFISGLARSLVKNSQEVFLLAGHGKGDQSNSSNVGAGRRFVARAMRFLDEVRPDIIHCHAHWYALAAGVSYSRRHPRVQLVFSFHTTTVPRWEGWFKRLLLRASVLTFVSGRQLAELRDKLSLRGDLRILRPATDLVAADPEAVRIFVREHSLQGHFPVLAFAGPLEYPMKVKGVIDLIASVRRVIKRFPTAKLLIVGDGSLRNQVASAAADLGSAVDITGFVSDPRPALSSVDLYCHISYQEGLPLSLLEAMSLGRCVLASPSGGIPEIINGTNGFLVGPGSGAIAAEITRLAEDSGARDSAGKAAFDAIARWHTWEARLSQVYSIYGLA